MKTFNRVFSTVLSVVIILVSFPHIVSDAADLDFRAYVISEFSEFKNTIDLSEYAKKNKWGLDELKAELEDMYMNTAEIYFVDITKSMSIREEYSSRTGSKFTISDITYLCKKSELEKMKSEYEAAVKKALSVVDKSMTDAEKVLALHEYIVLNNAYDTSYSRFSAYDALVRGSSVCQGYTLAYNDLLKRLGIGAIMAKSDKMQHAWSYVKIGDEWYHVDTTHDDPLSPQSGDYYGQVGHERFLKNTAEMKKLGYTDIYLSGKPNSTGKTYSSAFWKDVNSPIMKIDNIWYFSEFDENSGKMQIKAYDLKNKKKSTVYETDEIWFVGGTNDKYPSTYARTFASLATYNDMLYFSSSNAIYAFSPKTGETEKIKTAPEKQIYGFTMDENKIVYTLKNNYTDKNSLKSFEVTAVKQESPVKSDDEGVVNVEKISFSKKNLTIPLGKTYQIKTSISPKNHTEKILWKTSDKSIVTVSKDGKIKAKGEGICTITAYTESGVKKSIKIKVVAE